MIKIRRILLLVIVLLLAASIVTDVQAENPRIDVITIKGTINPVLVDYVKRGVEEETYACGTGTISSAILANKQKNIELPMNVQTRGGLLRVYFDDELSEIELEGMVDIIYSGELNQSQILLS